MTQTDTTVEYTRDELVEELEIGARRARQMSAAEFVRAVRNRSLHDVGEVADLAALVCLLPPDDPLLR